MSERRFYQTLYDHHISSPFLFFYFLLFLVPEISSILLLIFININMKPRNEETETKAQRMREACESCTDFEKGSWRTDGS
jgi:hypothetical protein